VDNWKSIAIGALVAGAAGLLLTLAWTTFSKGTAATIAENPAFTELHTKLDAQTEQIKSLSLQVTAMDLKFSTSDARIEARQDLIVNQSNAILQAHQ